MDHITTIDCGTCAVAGTGVCDDCLVTALLDEPGLLRLAAEEREALSNLAEAGLVAPLRLVPLRRRAR